MFVEGVWKESPVLVLCHSQAVIRILLEQHHRFTFLHLVFCLQDKIIKALVEKIGKDWTAVAALLPVSKLNTKENMIILLLCIIYQIWVV